MLRQTLQLAKHGIPWDVIAAMDDVERLACVIAVGENEGGVFDFTRMQWTKQR